MPDTWDFYEKPKGKWWWRRTASNGRVVGASTKAFDSRSQCRANARKNGCSADLWTFYQDKRKEWRWRRVAPNGDIVGACTEGYKHRSDCVENARRHGYYERRSKPSKAQKRFPPRGDRLRYFAAASVLDQKIENEVGLRIPFDVYLQDPSRDPADPGRGFAEDLRVAWEPHLSDGPTSARFAVVDYNSDTGTVTPPAKWVEGRQAFVHAGKVLDRSTAKTPQFHQVNVWAILQDALQYYEEGAGLGRAIPWGFDGSRLLVVPHAGYAENAFYDRASRSLQFYYFDGEAGRVETCLSADIIRHEFAHAILDGIRPYYLETCSVQTAAFHEFLGDLTAILLLLRSNAFRRRLAERLNGDLSGADELANIAREFGQAVLGRDYLRTARSPATMADMVGETRPHTVSQVLTGAMWEILLGISNGYIDGGASAKEAFWWAIDRMQRTALQPLDLLPPADVTFRDYALAVLRVEELSNPRDPRGYRRRMLDVFRSRGILSAVDEQKLSAPRYLHDRVRFDVPPVIGELSRSRADAYRFVDANRRTLRIPWNRDVVIADLYSARKLGRQKRRLPRQTVLQYVWREEVKMEGKAFGHLAGETTTLLCGGTLVFDERGNVQSWARKLGTEYTGGKASTEDVEAGRKRRDTILVQLAQAVRAGEAGDPHSPTGDQRAIAPLFQADVANGAVRFRLSPHLSLRDEDPEANTGARRWQMSF